MNNKSIEIRKQVIKKIDEIEPGEGFDIKYSDGICCEGDNITIGVRCTEIAGDVAIIVGGYGADFKIFNWDYHTTEKIVEEIEKEFIAEYYKIQDMEVF